MKFKELFKKNTDENLLKDTSNIPKVIFSELDLINQIYIGIWLGIIPIKRTYDMDILSQIQYDLLKNKLKVSDKTLEVVKISLGLVLKQMGIDSSETCIITKPDKNFKCHFNNDNDEATFNLRWGFLEDQKHIIFYYHNYTKVFNYPKHLTVNLDHYVAHSEDNASCYYEPSSFIIAFDLVKDNYRFIVNIENPNEEDKKLLRTFKLKYESELVDYLLKLSFPIEIDKVYKDICNICTDDISIYPTFELKARNNINITDLILLKNGKIEKFKITKNDKIIFLDSQNNWSYENKDFKLQSKTNDNSLLSPLEDIKAITEEVENVRKLTKTMIEKR